MYKEFSLVTELYLKFYFRFQLLIIYNLKNFSLAKPYFIIFIVLK